MASRRLVELALEVEEVDQGHAEQAEVADGPGDGPVMKEVRVAVMGRPQESGSQATGGGRKRNGKDGGLGRRGR